MQVCTFYTPEYARAVRRLKLSCDQHGYDYDEAQFPSQFCWEGNCAQKPRALLELLNRYDSFVYLDADQWIKSPLSWFEENESELELVVDKHESSLIFKGHRAQKYKYIANRYGYKLLTGFMFLRRTDKVIKLLKLWRDISEKNSYEWDEHALFRAIQKTETAELPKITILPKEYKVFGGKKIGHHSQSLPVWKDTIAKPIRKVLILGSANYMPKWVEDNLEKYLDAGFAVLCLNNSFNFVNNEYVHLWYRPLDFKPAPNYSESPPSDVPRNENFRYRTDKTGRFLASPYFDEQIKTIFTHTCYSLLNEAIRDEAKLCIHAVGCDMDYSANGNSHAYGSGTSDPLRYDISMLQNALSRLKSIFISNGSSIYNAGGHEPTLLPFLRADSPHFTEVKMLIKMPKRITKKESEKIQQYIADRRLYTDTYGNIVEENDPARRKLFLAKGQKLPGGIKRAIELGLVVVDDEREDAPEPVNTDEGGQVAVKKKSRGRPKKK